MAIFFKCYYINGEEHILLWFFLCNCSNDTNSTEIFNATTTVTTTAARTTKRIPVDLPKKGSAEEEHHSSFTIFFILLVVGMWTIFFWQLLQFNPSFNYWIFTYMWLMCTLWIWFYLLRFYKINFYVSVSKKCDYFEEWFLYMYYKEFVSFYKLLTCFLFQHWQYWPHTCLFKQGFITYLKVLQTYY